MAERPYRLRTRLLLGLLLPLPLLLAISGLVSYRMALSYANSVYDGWLYDSAGSLAQALEILPSGTRLNLPGAAQRLFEWDVEDKTYFEVSGSRSGHIAGRNDLPDVPEDAVKYGQALLFDAVLDGAFVREAAFPVSHPGSESVLIKVAETDRKRRGLARQILLSALVPQLILALIAALVVWVGVKAGLSPLQQITSSIRRQPHRSVARLPEDQVPAEVSPLIQALNDLLARLDKALAAQRIFVADAAHQLRTPLATLKLLVDEARASRSREELDRTLDALLSSTNRAARLSHQLLSLARAEPDAEHAQVMEPLNLVALARETGAEWVPPALAKGMDLSFESKEPAVTVIGNAVLLREALNNILDNAIKHHPGQGRIALIVTADPPGITIEDDGPGIALNQREFVFRRFHRGDRSGGDGAGLGLAIVREIATLHGGNVSLEDGANNRGLTVQLSFPAAGQAAVPP